MIFEEDYRGHAIRIVAVGRGPFRWRFAIDGDVLTFDGDAYFNTTETALRDGRSAARFEIDLRLALEGGDT